MTGQATTLDVAIWAVQITLAASILLAIVVLGAALASHWSDVSARRRAMRAREADRLAARQERTARRRLHHTNSEPAAVVYPIAWARSRWPNNDGPGRAA